MVLKIGVIGVGSFGEKRAAAVQECDHGQLIGIADIDPEKSRAVADKFGVACYNSDTILDDDAIDAVIICTPNKCHMPVTIKALKAGKHVLCEKPLARTAAEAQQMIQAAEEAGKFLKTGSNHRYFESVMKANELIRQGTIGEVINLTGRIGNNGERIQNKWFWDKDISGGGTLLDNGCHLLDIARWFMGDFVEAAGLVSNVYWKKCPVEDTASGIFLTQDGKMATINSSWRQLSGYFHIEISGTSGYITIDGRFDTHGGDNLYWQSNHGKGEIHSTIFDHVKPKSYLMELDAFFDDISNGVPPTPSGTDGLAVLRMVEAIYKSNKRTVRI